MSGEALDRIAALEREVKLIWEAIGLKPSDPKTLAGRPGFMEGRDEWLAKSKEKDKGRIERRRQERE